MREWEAEEQMEEWEEFLDKTTYWEQTGHYKVVVEQEIIIPRLQRQVPMVESCFNSLLCLTEDLITFF